MQYIEYKLVSIGVIKWILVHSRVVLSCLCMLSFSISMFQLCDRVPFVPEGLGRVNRPPKPVGSLAVQILSAVRFSSRCNAT